MVSRRTRASVALAFAVVFGLLLAGGTSWAAPPPTLEVQTIGAGTVKATGISCGGGHLTCATAYGSSVDVTLTAVPASGWTFKQWDDDGAGCPTNPCTLPSINNDNFVTAVFATTNAVQLATLTTSVTFDDSTPPVAEGSVTDPSLDSPISCPAGSCTQQVLGGSTLTLQEAPASSSYFFDQWAGSCSGNHEWCSVYLPVSRTATADFVTAGTSTLTVTVDGGGTVTGGGLTCGAGSTCTVQEPTNGSFTLTATAQSGYTFDGWSGTDCAGDQPTCTVNMSVDRDATATFVQVVPLLLTVNGPGTVTGDSLSCGPGPQTCSGSAAPGSTVQFTATPSTAGGTVSWVGCTSASGTICNVVVNSSPISVTATFGGGTTGGGGGSFVQLTVSVSGDGYVTSTGAATIYCTAAGGAGCTATVQQNSSVQLHAVAATGSAFLDWGGSCAGTSTTCVLTMSVAKSVSATFNGDNTTNNLTVSIVGSGSVTGGGLVRCTVTGAIGCTAPQAADARVTITAVPNPGQAFAGWSGDCTGTTSTCTVDMGDDQNVTATFQATTPQTSKLELTVAGAGSVSGGTEPCTSKGKPTTCTSTERNGSTVDLKATPAKGYVFTGWTGACTGTKPCTITITEDTKVTATFAIPLRLTKKPAVSKLHVTFHFAAAEAGHLTVIATHKGSKPVKVVKTVKAGKGLVRITVKTHGRWLFTLSLRSKSGVHTLHYRIKL